jgi:hypothetical protein
MGMLGFDGKLFSHMQVKDASLPCKISGKFQLLITQFSLLTPTPKFLG